MKKPGLTDNLPATRQISSLYETLFRRYGPQGWWPIVGRAGERGYDEGGYHPGLYPAVREDSVFDIACGAVLTQNTSWKNAETALKSLHSRGIDSFSALGEINSEILAEIIHSSGYYNQKAKKLKALSVLLATLGPERGGAREAAPKDLRERLLGVWGVGPETVDSILLYAFDISTFVIDAYTRRLLERIFDFPGLPGGVGGYHLLQDLFHRSVPRDTVVYGEYHALIVRHCKEVCTVRPRCERCMLASECRFYRAASR